MNLRTTVHVASVGAGVFLLIVGIVMAMRVHDAKVSADKRHAARLQGADDSPPPTGTPPVEVKAGIYVERIPEIGFSSASWTVDFYVWFDWQGDRVQPGKTFQVVDGDIESRELVREVHEGGRNYELYRVKATFTKVFDVTRFPADDHMLMIAIEDGEHDVDTLRFVADVEGSSTSSRVKMPGYVVTRTGMAVKAHAYKTTRGDPALSSDTVSTHSQMVYGISIARPGWELFLKLFLALYVAIAVSMLIFFIEPTDVDARFGLSVGALFAVMANAYVISASVPEASGMSMADLITGIAILTLLLTLAQSTAALQLHHRGHEELVKRFDRLSFASLMMAFVAVNVMIPLAAI